MRILIIEDDKKTSDFLKSVLENEQFAVDQAFDGVKGSYMARTNDYDLIILDNLLPLKNGSEVCREIRERKKAVKVLALSVQAETEDIVGLLDNGADDYITKPFSFEEVIARIRALLRRSVDLIDNKIIIGDLQLSVTSGKVLVAGKEVSLTNKEFMILEFLMRNAGKIMSRGKIMEHVWDINQDPFSNTLEMHIKNLRDKIESERKTLIKTVPGRGYTIG